MSSLSQTGLKTSKAADRPFLSDVFRRRSHRDDSDKSGREQNAGWSKSIPLDLCAASCSSCHLFAGNAWIFGDEFAVLGDTLEYSDDRRFSFINRDGCPGFFATRCARWIVGNRSRDSLVVFLVPDG
jgi:hypothetical protein